MFLNGLHFIRTSKKEAASPPLGFRLFETSSHQVGVFSLISLGSHAFDNLVLKEPLNLNSILHSETLSDPGRYIPNLGKSIARLSSLLEQRSQPLPGLDQYALPKASSPVARNNAKPMLFQPKDTPASKKQKTEKHTPSNGPLKIVLKFYLLICTDWSSYRDRATHLN
ncbi:hypothetical protein DI09_31p40 [Mitosporidium daphniae]|uniref:Uncharacterized protein n=1 Tax=Mitosporidium daphniae TaxID=1485682 RepID=A0A098VR80_9MICR|nr:uncharacterized protein DI09_31p40 [Mitosporidium daphniae]KGG51553.1 hypothetical protein DI09_31p40 [Mitosporidium daphniae]|eukprot:XP_013238006.1 uncharacterized protein DI09_31p40 [Mitosporidium daphniae]